MSDNLPDFIYQESQYLGSNGRVVLRRHIIDGKVPEKWREFLGVAQVDLPIGEQPDGKVLTKRHEIIFPFFGIAVHGNKTLMKCVRECFKVYDQVAEQAQKETIDEYKKAVRAHLAKEQTKIEVPAAATAGERHLDRDGNEIPEPARPAGRKSIIIGG